MSLSIASSRCTVHHEHATSLSPVTNQSKPSPLSYYSQNMLCPLTI